MPFISPFVINIQLITDFREKANFFNLYFAKHCTSIKNDSSIPTDTKCLCDATISEIDFEDQDTLKIIWALDMNKAHSQDNMLTRMIKVSDSSTVKPLSIIFRNSFSSGIFPENRKRSNLPNVPVHKKGNNYRRMSLLPIGSKISEMLIFNSLYKFVQENSLLCFNQSEFKKNDLCVNQLLSIVHQIYDNFQ